MMGGDGDVNGFPYSESLLHGLGTSLSRERLGTYLAASGGDQVQALRLYTWNTAVSAAFYGPLQGLEIALRNAIHTQLSHRYGTFWFDNPDTGLDAGASTRIAAARSDLDRSGKALRPDRIVARLSFGFWVSLTGRGERRNSGRKANYEMTLWRPALRNAFPHRERLVRRQVHGPLIALRLLRNRIAHHEPVIRRDLSEDHDLVLEVAGWMSPAMRSWIEYHSRVPTLLAKAEKAGLRFF